MTFGYWLYVSLVSMVVYVIQYDLQKIGSSILNKTEPQRDAFYTQLWLEQVSIIYFGSDEEINYIHKLPSKNRGEHK